MQLSADKTELRRRLVMASCALLGAAHGRAQEAPQSPATSGDADSLVVDTGLGYYKESNGRIAAIEPVVRLRADDGAGHVTSLNVTFDSLSGSSPNGALTSNKPQTFATPSGNSLSGVPQTYTTSSGQAAYSTAPTYVVAAGQLPADPNYHDQRLAVDGEWRLPLSALTHVNLGGKFSWEHDFLSVTGSAAVARDFNDRNTTLSVGVNEEADAIKPIGGAPVPGSEYALFSKQGNKSKNGLGLLAGATQVMSPRWLSEFNVSLDRFRGYLNDPYKIVSVLDAAGNTTGYLFERRPSERTRRSAYLDNRFAWSHSSTSVALRYMTDDWGIHSQTAQVRLRLWNPQRDRYVEPSVRGYRQSAAAFYAPWLTTSSPQYVDVSADERLGAFHAVTYALKYGVKRQPAAVSEFNVRLEYYQQIADHPSVAPPALQGLNLFPGLRAVLLQVDYHFGG